MEPPLSCPVYRPRNRCVLRRWLLRRLQPPQHHRQGIGNIVQGSFKLCNAQMGGCLLVRRSSQCQWLLIVQEIKSYPNILLHSCDPMRYREPIVTARTACHPRLRQGEKTTAPPAHRFVSSPLGSSRSGEHRLPSGITTDSMPSSSQVRLRFTKTPLRSGHGLGTVGAWTGSPFIYNILILLMFYYAPARVLATGAFRSHRDLD